jgi:predicted anti-sigma-YlaC factor YlaD
MNCELCQKVLDAYQEGMLPEGTRSQVEVHLGECKECSESFQLVGLANRVMEDEKSMQSNPFLVTRIMANIDQLEQSHGSYQTLSVYQKVLKPVLLGFSVAAAIFFGVVMGNFNMQTQATTELPVEMTYMNDVALESVDVLSQL